MNYKTRISILEDKGIKYHRVISRYILNKITKIYPRNVASILVYGDKDLLISYLLAEEYHIHVDDTSSDGPENNNRVTSISLKEKAFSQYDIVIGLFVEDNIIKNIINSGAKFFIIPKSFPSNQTTIEYLKSENIKFSRNTFDLFIQNNVIFSNV